MTFRSTYLRDFQKLVNRYRSVTIPLLASVFAVDIILLLVVAQLLEGEIWKVSHAFPGVLGLAVLQKCVFGN
ncbi:hypothetical protein A2T98_00135 [Nodularia spumigena CENA596]|uniref:Uncharacterized protein n=1 Tax=Nodularia spumigena CENA596 TaxID=1819295 RepID=A0A166L1P0_NODSP|nr:hypothetical protein A2T98_00135 [Nodularia spumigena CENA596]